MSNDELMAEARELLDRKKHWALLDERVMVAKLLDALAAADASMTYLAGHDRTGRDHLDEAMLACSERDDAEAKLRKVKAIATDSSTHPDPYLRDMADEILAAVES